jgi:hypothetical protein
LPEQPQTLHFTKPAGKAPAASAQKKALIAPRMPAVKPPARATSWEQSPSLASYLRPVAFQQAAPRETGRGTEEPGEFTVQLEPPGPQRLFRLESERSLQERMRQEARERPSPERIAFPEEPIATGGGSLARVFPPGQELVEPYYVCHGRLYFEDLNSERYGWDLGFIQPLVSTGIFFYDVALLPYHLATEPCRCYECSAGYCLPGDPVPYLIYPPEISLTGTLAEVGVIAGLIAVFP